MSTHEEQEIACALPSCVHYGMSLDRDDKRQFVKTYLDYASKSVKVKEFVENEPEECQKFVPEKSC